MSLDRIKNQIKEDGLNEQPPEIFSQFPDENVEPIMIPKSFVLMRIMLVIVNLSALILGRSFLQSWYGVHGTTPVWIPLMFLIVPLGSVAFIYYYMGRIGSERIIKMICFVCCIIQALSIFFPINSSEVSLGKDGYSYDHSYVTNAGNEIGIKFPSCVRATTVDGNLAESDKKDAFTSIKAFFNGEKIYCWTDVIYNSELTEDFEKFVKENPLWLTEVPENLKQLACTSMTTDGYDKFLFFDRDARKYNSLPESGRHTVYQVMYSLKNHEMRIIKYTKNF